MKEIVSTVTRKAQVTIPREVRRQLGVQTPDKVAIVLDDAGVRLKSAAVPLKTLYGSVPPLPGRETVDFEDQIVDFEDQIEEAMEEAADQIEPRPGRR